MSVQANRCEAVYRYVPVGGLRTVTSAMEIPPRCEKAAGHDDLMHRSGEVSWPTAQMLSASSHDPHRTGWGAPGVPQRSFG